MSRVIQISIDADPLSYRELSQAVGKWVYISPNADGIPTHGPYRVEELIGSLRLVKLDGTAFAAEDVHLNTFWLPSNG